VIFAGRPFGFCARHVNAHDLYWCQGGNPSRL
jgi:hypothetical protein